VYKFENFTTYIKVLQGLHKNCKQMQQISRCFKPVLGIRPMSNLSFELRFNPKYETCDCWGENPFHYFKIVEFVRIA